ncbi:MAG: GDP-L-fucose synthase [Phycisphaerae bacterium]
MRDESSIDERFWRHRRVCVTGGAGFVGRALCRRLKILGCMTPFVPRRADYDLTQAEAVRRMYRDSRPDIVFHLAAQVGGIGANRSHPGRFFYANMVMGLHLIEQARHFGVQKFVQVGTVCSYPKHCPVPFREDSLWDGYPEPTNAPYGIAKKSLLVMLQAYRAEYGLNGIFVMPVNLYGPGDNFDVDSCHVIPALIRKFHQAKQDGAADVLCWGTGRASREFLYVNDAASAILKAGQRYNGDQPINIGTGSEITIRSLAELIAELVGYDGRIEWDPSKPDGQPRRRLDTSRAAQLLDWQGRTDLPTGLRRTIDWWTKRAAPALV